MLYLREKAFSFCNVPLQVLYSLRVSVVSRQIFSFSFMHRILVYLIQGFTNIDVVAIMPVFWIVLGLSLAEGMSATSEATNYPAVTVGKWPRRRGAKNAVGS